MLLTQQKTINERHDALEKYVKASILDQTKIIEERYVEKADNDGKETRRENRRVVDGAEGEDW